MWDLNMISYVMGEPEVENGRSSQSLSSTSALWEVYYYLSINYNRGNTLVGRESDCPPRFSSPS